MHLLPYLPRFRRANRVASSISALSRFFSNGNTHLSPYRVAIVGSGPSGCYTAKYLHAQKDLDFQIDILERLPTAYGLVRNGVAPDHPEVKNVQNDFDALLKEPQMRFYGNVQVGKDVALNELRERYDMVVLAYGCESDRSLNIPGAQAKGILSAREFVAWYNGHVDFGWVGSIVSKALDKPTSNIVVLGHGNVALDCARILAKTRDELDPTDIATRALDIVHPTDKKGERRISIVGRRGHVQGAFTIKELRELTKLPHTDFVVRSDELELGKATSASKEELKMSRPRTRMDKLLMEAAAKQADTSNTYQAHLRFLMNPIRFESTDDDSGQRLKSVVCERTMLQGETGSQEAVGTGDMESIDADLALVSIGYKGVGIEGTERFFDKSRGVLQNTHGLVDNASDQLGALYTAGWLKRGPSGIIGTNIPDAKDTVATMIHDIESCVPRDSSLSQTSLVELLEERGVQYVDWEAYQRIDDAEKNETRKRHKEQPREKFVTVNDLMAAARVSS